jgi:hypothetical protein
MSRVNHNLSELTARLNRAVKEVAPNAVRDFQRLISFEILRRVVLKTPVDEGRARGNWTISINAPVVAHREDFSGDPIVQGVQTLGNLGIWQTVYIGNAVPYIHVLEYGLFVPPNPGPSKDPRQGRFGRILVQDGFSTQAPEGMARLSVQEVIQFVRSRRPSVTVASSAPKKPRRTAPFRDSSGRLRDAAGKFISER